MIPKLPTLAALLALVGPAAADILMPGYHVVPRTVCYQVGRTAESQEQQLLAVIETVQGQFLYRAIDGERCLDQGYKFNRVVLFWAPRASLANGLPDSTTNPSKLSYLIPIANLNTGEAIVSNQIQVPDSIPQIGEDWTYTVIGNYFAETLIQKQFQPVGGIATESSQHIDYFWPQEALGVSQTSRTPALAVVGVRGDQVTLRIPAGSDAQLSIHSAKGQLLRQMRIAPTNGSLGSVKLGLVPPRGSVVELRQGTLQSTKVSGTR